jgi:hypothetical protein
MHPAIMAYELTDHARESLRKRSIRQEWVERAFCHPQRVEADRVDPELEHRLVRINECGDRASQRRT